MTAVKSDDPPFQHIGIFGVGLLGGSLGLAVKHLWPQTRVVGIGRSPERLSEAAACGAVDEISTMPGAIEPALDLLIVCTPVRMIPEHFSQTLPSLASGAIVTDVGSTKGELTSVCERIAGGRVRFIGSHPMAGSHKTGLAAASADLFEDRVCVVTPSSASDPEALKRVQSFWNALGMRVITMTPGEHDRLTARSSHAPHIAAAALCHAAASAGDAILPVIGSGFKDATRIACGSPDVWLDICMDNREALCEALSSLQDVLGAFQQRLQDGDERAVYEFLEQARRWREGADTPS
ncbi:MAG: prephenate dehydrogenase/arogenate dehydrogenase family protein [bacterium]|nr:prephenate dehydrogenase/arogenate dehydrogenase family protein [bacterium]